MENTTKNLRVPVTPEQEEILKKLRALYNKCVTPDKRKTLRAFYSYCLVLGVERVASDLGFDLIGGDD